MIKGVSSQEVYTAAMNAVKSETAAQGASFMDSIKQAVARTDGDTGLGDAFAKANGANAQLRAQQSRANEARIGAGTDKTDGAKRSKDAAKAKDTGKDKPVEDKDTLKESEKDDENEAAAAQSAMAAQLGMQTEETNMLLDAQEGAAQQGAVQMDEAAPVVTAEAGIAEAVGIEQDQIDFVQQVMDEIEQSVASNEAERSEPVIAQEALSGNMPGEAKAEKEAAAPRVYDIDRSQENETQSGAPLHMGAANAAAGAEPDAVVTLPENAQEAQRVVFDSLLEQVESAVTQEKSELNIRFKPDVFGGMQIRLTMTEEGLRAQIRTTDAAVRGMLNAELSELTSTLRARGIEVVEMDVYYEQTTADNQFLGQGSGSWRGEQEQGGQRRYGSAEIIEEGGYEAAYSRMIPTEDEAAAGGIIYSA